MTIYERIEKEKAFKELAKNLYKDGIPSVKLGDIVETIHGRGVVVDVYTTELSESEYPMVKIDSGEIILKNGNVFEGDTAMYYPYDYIRLVDKGAI